MTILRNTIAIGGIWAFLAVSLGALGAHGLKDTLTANETSEVWKTAVDYQMWHAIALILCGLMQTAGKPLRAPTILFNFGILLFSGSLYWLSLGGPKWLGPITPLGGLCFLSAWALFIWIQLRNSENH
ncbi:MAG: DUF423 domain-containing protein [Opitutaceae bacterium]